MQNLQRVIHEALHTHDNNEKRSQAEQHIFQLAHSNFTDFFTSLANLIADDSKSVQTRQSSGIVFKRMLTVQDENGGSFWDRVNINSKENIKQTLLATLVSPNNLVMKAGANAVATIAFIEIRRGHWLEIIRILAENSQHSNDRICMASIITIGFICEQLKNSRGDLDRDASKQILVSLAGSLGKTGQFLEVAITALRDSIQFLAPILEDRALLNYLFEYLLPILNIPDVRFRVYQVMDQIAKNCYHLLGNYIGTIVQFTVSHMQNRAEETAFALSLWETIAEEYNQRVAEQHSLAQKSRQLPNYIIDVQEQILPDIMACLLINNQADLEFPRMREAAVAALSCIVQAGNLAIVDRISEGARTILNSPNPGQRQATVLMFSCLSSYSDRDEIAHRFRGEFKNFYKLLLDKIEHVVKNTLNGFLTLSEKFPEVWMQDQEIKQIFEHLLGMSAHQNEDIRILSLTILGNITEELPNFPDPIARNPKDEMKHLIDMLAEGIEKGDNKECLEKIIIVIINIIIGTSNASLVNQLVIHMLSQYHQYSRQHIQDKDIVLDYCLSIIHTGLLHLSKTANLRPGLQNDIFNLVDVHIKNHGIEQEGINLISASSSCFKAQFRNRIENYWRFIVHALEQVDQKPLFRTTLSCISDIARNHQDCMQDKLVRVFRTLMEDMKKPIDREIKVDILGCFGDLALGITSQTEHFLVDLLEIVENCFEAVYTFSVQETEKPYADELKETLIETYHSLLFALNSDTKCNQRLANHFGNISTFIVNSCSAQMHPKVEYMVNCLYMVFDGSLFFAKSNNFKDQADNVVRSKQIQDIIQRLKPFSDREEVKTLFNYIDSRIVK